jgi:outer membrane protein assembly factor BamB
MAVAKMHQPRVLMRILIAAVFASSVWPGTAFAKRSAPTPVPPVIWEGIEFRAPLDVDQMGCVQAFELASGRKLWESKVYRIWISPLEETDVQWVFITSLKVQGSKLIVRNEAGRTYQVDLKTGRVDGGIWLWISWSIPAVLAALAAFFIGRRVQAGKRNELSLPQLPHITHNVCYI